MAREAQLDGLSKLRWSRISNRKRELVIQSELEARDHWAKIKSDVELDPTPLPDLHLLRDVGQSPAGTLFP
jgi:hypothetical protein